MLFTKLIFYMLVIISCCSYGFAAEMKSNPKTSLKSQKQFIRKDNEKFSVRGTDSCVANVTCQPCVGNIKEWPAYDLAFYDSNGNSLGVGAGYGDCPTNNQQVPSYVSGLCQSFSYQQLLSSNQPCTGM